MYATVDVNRTAITPLAVFGVHVSAATEIAMATANIAQVSITLAWITNNYIHDLSYVVMIKYFLKSLNFISVFKEVSFTRK